ncbi:hypothetical protein XENTR_v10020382 [Xenopus tropicalis]|nr:hypothetical protein XENTR_v10020382 [Xenopus tropicalis]
MSQWHFLGTISLCINWSPCLAHQPDSCKLSQNSILYISTSEFESLAFLCVFRLHVPAPERIPFIRVQAHVGGVGRYFQQSLFRLPKISALILVWHQP